MASRFRSLSRPSLTFLKSNFTKSSNKPTTAFHISSSSPTQISRSISQLGCLQSLLPLHSSVSSARLTSCLGIDSKGTRSLSQELGLSMPR